MACPSRTAAAAPVPPRVSIVDGTHLCLMPPSEAIFPEKDPPVAVPAVPLRFVPYFLSRICRPLSSLAGDSSPSSSGVGADNGGGGSDEEDDETDDGDSDGGETPEVIRLPLHLSGPLSMCQSVERSLTSGSVLAHTDVGAPMLVSVQPLDGSPRREEEERCFAGTARLIAPPDGRRGGVGRCGASEFGGRTALEVDNGGAGCVVADFCGWGGFDQILFLPPLSPGIASKSSSVSAGVEGGSSERDGEAEALLRTILRRSVLTDGTGALLPRSGQGVVVGPSTERGTLACFPKRGRCPNVTIRVVDSLDDDDEVPRRKCDGTKRRKDRNDKSEARKKDRREKRRKDLHKDAGSFGAVGAVEHGKAKHLAGEEPTDEGGTVGGEASSGGNAKKGRWAAVLEAGIRSRLEREERLRSEADAARNERAYLAERSQRALETFIAASPASTSVSVLESASSKTSTEKQSFAEIPTARSDKEGGMKVPRLQMVRMRYSIRPGGAGSASIDGDAAGSPGGLSILMHVEVDVLLRDQKEREERAADYQSGGGTAVVGDSAVDPVALREFHIAFAPAPCPCADTLSVSTRSGVVPALQPGECVTIVALVEVTGIRTPFDPAQKGEGEEDRAAVALAINAHWKTKDERGDEDCKVVVNPRRLLRAGGSALGAIRLPMESIVLSGVADRSGNRADEEADYLIDFFSPPQWPPPVGNSRKQILRASDYDDDSDNDDFTTSNYPATVESNTIYDYRRPRVLEIDASHSADGGLGELESLVASINSMASFGNRVDIDRGDWGSSADSEKNGSGDGTCGGEGVAMRLRLVVLGRSPEERLALVQLVLKYMPESARILDPVDNGGAFPREESAAASDLLTCMRDEVDALERHRKMREEDFTTKTLREMAELQRRTDEAASRIRRGWDNKDCSTK